MASRRDLKKSMDYMIFDALDECYSVQLYNPAKKEESDFLIDEIVNFRNDMISQIYQSKSKSDYKKIIKDIEEHSETFFDKINLLY